MTNFRQSTKSYEGWLRGQLGGELVEKDLERKHEKMRDSAFAFLRATYWRWAETVLDICPDAASAPKVLAVGDIHLENFGTWRDADGRLAWGMNDFDEAAEMPYVIDLIRLATSALAAANGRGIATEEHLLRNSAGYREGLKAPHPVVLDRDQRWLRELVVVSEKKRAKFWKKIEKVDGERCAPRYRKALSAAMPEPRPDDERPRAGRPVPAVWAGRAGSASPTGAVRRSCARRRPLVPSGLAARARQGQGKNPLRGARQGPPPRHRPVVSHRGQHCGAPPLAQQPQDRGR